MPEFDITFEHRSAHTVRALDEVAALRAARDDLRVQLAVLGDKALTTSWTRVVRCADDAAEATEAPADATAGTAG